MTMIVAINANTCRRYFYATFLSVSCLFASSAVHAKVFPVVVHSEFHNDNWFPLSAQDMESAAVDTALSGLSSSKAFAFMLDSEQRRPSDHTGDVYLTVTLVEPAETAKITIRLSLPDNGGTFVSTASGSLSNMGYQSIFRVFENIGRSASGQLNDTLTELGKLDDDSSSDTDKSLPVEPILELNREFINLQLLDALGEINANVSTINRHNKKVMIELGKLDQIISKLDQHDTFVRKQAAVTERKLDDIYSSIQVLSQNLGGSLPDKEALTAADVAALTLLEESLRYKYKHAFHEADNRLDDILALPGLSPRVRELVAEEKNFDLPLFEAQVKTTELRLGFMEMRANGSYRDRIMDIRSIYVGLLKQNDPDFKRQVAIKQRLDELMLMSGDMEVVDQYASKAAYQNFKRLMMTWESRRMVMGRGKGNCPSGDELKQMVKQAGLLADVHAVKEIQYGCQVVFKRGTKDYVIIKGSDMQYELIESASF